MASFNQNIVRYEHDGEFDLVYTVSNSGTILSNTSMCAVWLLLNTDSVTSSSTLKIIGSSVSLSSAANFNVDQNGANCSASAVKLSTTTASSVTVGITSTSVTVPFTWSIFSALDPGDYYHELVLTVKSNGVCYQCQSQVVSTGLLTVEESLFTNKQYR